MHNSEGTIEEELALGAPIEGEVNSSLHKQLAPVYRAVNSCRPTNRGRC